MPNGFKAPVGEREKLMDGEHECNLRLGESRRDPSWSCFAGRKVGVTAGEGEEPAATEADEGSEE